MVLPTFASLLPQAPVPLERCCSVCEGGYDSSDYKSDWIEGTLSPPSSPVPRLLDLINEIENNEPEIPSYCVVCDVRQPSVMFLGCNHIPVCRLCIRGVQIAAEGGTLRCPLCNTPGGVIVGQLP